MNYPRQWTLIQGASRGIGLELVRQCLQAGENVIATARDPETSPGLRELRHGDLGRRLHCMQVDLCDEASIESAAYATKRLTPHLDLLMNVAGLLHDERHGPERSLADVDPVWLSRVFEVNAFGPLLVAKHFGRCFQRQRPAVFANLSARVGSIGDNRKGGWYGYRASKAAQNMFTKNLAIELGRKYKQLVVLALHPGTVDTDMSRPFTANYDADKLFDVERAAKQLLGICDDARPEDSGRFVAWDGQAIEW